jgi:tetratricopeptide (TPR) repeat protein
VLEAYQRRDFEFIISTTAKDRELSHTGIVGIDPALSSFESLLDDILDVLGFPADKKKPTQDKEKSVIQLISNSNGLIFVDNLETVDDTRIISFLDDLPVGVKAITTSRKTRVRVSVFPVDVLPMNPEEVLCYLRSLSNSIGLEYLEEIQRKDADMIAGNCDGIPLAVSWAAQRCKQVPELLAYTNSLKESGKHGEELLEFSYRRIFDNMNDAEKAILNVLSIFNKPISEEVILAGNKKHRSDINDYIEELVEDSLIQRFFDSDLNDYTYSLLPITRAFVYAELHKQSDKEATIRQRLTDYFEARDIQNPERRDAVRAIRQGKRQSDEAYVDIAITARNQGDFQTAEKLFRQAIQTKPDNWRAHQEFGELYRHNLQNLSKAIEHYELAARYAPKQGDLRGLIFHELAVLYKDSGYPDALDKAIKSIEVALKEKPKDSHMIVTAASLYNRKGHPQKAINLLKPHVGAFKGRDEACILSQLLIAYHRNRDFVNEKLIQAEYNRLPEYFKQRQ